MGALSQPCAPPNGGTGELKKGTVKLEDVTLVFDSCSDMVADSAQHSRRLGSRLDYLGADSTEALVRASTLTGTEGAGASNSKKCQQAEWPSTGWPKASCPGKVSLVS